MAEETRNARAERQARAAAFWQKTVSIGRELENSQRQAAQQKPAEQLPERREQHRPQRQ